MKNQNSHEMWKNALTQTDEKYIAEAAELAPESENIRTSPAGKKHGTGNLGFIFATTAAVIVSFIGVGFLFKGTGTEPPSPSAGSGSIIEGGTDEGVNNSTTMTTTVTMDENSKITAIVSTNNATETTTVEKQSLTMEDLKALVNAKGKELTWSDFEPFEGRDIGSGLYIMYYEIDDNYAVAVGGVPTEKPWYIRLISNTYDSFFSITDNGAEGFEEFIEGFSPFALLGNYYGGQDGLFHVSGENWTVCENYDLFREYFFGVWGDDFIIDDSEKDWVVASRSIYFDNYYKVNDNVLAVVYHGFAGGELRWLDMRNPNVLYEAYGGIGDFPEGFPKNEDGTPAVFTKKKTSGVTNEPENNFLSIYRLKELSKQYGIPLETLTDIEFQDENGAVYHDSKYNSYPMYLVFESDNRLVINTEARAPYGDDGRRISLVFEKFTGKWERTVDFKWEHYTILKGNFYSEKEMPSEIIIPEGITEIGEGVFEDCTQIEKVTLPSTLKVIGAEAFKDCANLKEINIPYGVTTIGEHAFENCTSVYMVLPDTVTTIEDGAFAGCTQFDGTFKTSTQGCF